LGIEEREGVVEVVEVVEVAIQSLISVEMALRTLCLFACAALPGTAVPLL
jgi:hypothetical protein